MSPKFTFLVALLCASAAAPGQDADEWVPLVSGIDGSKFSISHIRQKDRNSPTAWVRKENAEAGPNDAAYSIGLWRFDCPAKRMQVLSYVIHRLNGSVIQSGGPLEDGFVKTGTAADVAMKQVCPPVPSPKFHQDEPAT